VIMSAHPYGKDKIAAKSKSGRSVDFQYRLCPQPAVVSISDLTSWEAPDPAVWAPRDYCVINADLRGSGTSEGVGEVFTELEADDYYDLIEWAGTQPWSNGRVGLDGVSYLATSQCAAAATKPPHLAAICPWRASAICTATSFAPAASGRTVLASFAAMISKVSMKTKLRPQFVGRTERDAWWKARTPTLEDIDVLVLVCGSFSDHSLHTRGSFELFRRAGSTRKWLYTHREGKWSTYYGADATQTRLRFFDHFLKGETNGWNERPAVRLAIHDIGSCRGRGQLAAGRS
jgi:uncharacterized protein